MPWKKQTENKYFIVENGEVECNVSSTKCIVVFNFTISKIFDTLLTYAGEN